MFWRYDPYCLFPHQLFSAQCQNRLHLHQNRLLQKFIFYASIRIHIIPGIQIPLKFYLGIREYRRHGHFLHHMFKIRVFLQKHCPKSFRRRLQHFQKFFLPAGNLPYRQLKRPGSVFHLHLHLCPSVTGSAFRPVQILQGIPLPHTIQKKDQSQRTSCQSGQA